MPISAIDAVGPAFEHTKRQLFQPFRAGQWARLAFVGFLAGELSSGGCNTFQIPTRTHVPHRFVAYHLPQIDPALYAGLIAFLIVFAVVFYFLFLYLNSVMRFILFDSVIAKQCQIRSRWGSRQGPGLRYFGWQILFFLAGPFVLAVLIGIPAAFAFALGWFKDPRQHLVGLILGGMALFFLVFAFLAIWMIVHVLTKDFVVPQMALENIGAFEGWRRLLPRLQSEKGGYAAYIGLKIVMALGAAVVIGIAATIVILLLLIPVGGFGALAVLAGKAAGLTWNLYTITLVVTVGFAALVVISYVVAVISVPAIVFFPAYSIYFFAGRYPILDGVLNPPPAPPALLSPEPAPIG